LRCGSFEGAGRPYCGSGADEAGCAFGGAEATPSWYDANALVGVVLAEAV